MHTDIAGERDVEPPRRVAHLPLRQHAARPRLAAAPGRSARPRARAGVHGFNAVDYSPLMRAALVNLDRWVSEGAEPPPSAFPRLADGTAVTGREVVEPLPRASPASTVPDPDRLPLGLAHRPRPGRRPGHRAARRHARASGTRPRLAVDADGNEVGGMRLPDLTVPVATYTGWNPRHPSTGRAGPDHLDAGLDHPLPGHPPPTAQQRGDPRPSIEERYRDRDDYRRSGARRRRGSGPAAATSWTRTSTSPSSLRQSGTTPSPAPRPPSAANSFPSPSGRESMRRSAGACPPLVSGRMSGGQAPALRIYEAAGEGSSPAAGRGDPGMLPTAPACTCPREAASQPDPD